VLCRIELQNRINDLVCYGLACPDERGEAVQGRVYKKSITDIFLENAE
jgi:hypothetical protein